MNASFRLPKRISLRLVLMHAVLIALVTVAMITSMPVSGMNG